VEHFDEGLAGLPDALVISVPMGHQREFAETAANTGLPFFTEVNIVEDLSFLEPVCHAKAIVGCPSFTMKFHPAVRLLKSLLETGVLDPAQALLFQSGQALPDWHPWEDYRGVYFSKRNSGGAREMLPFHLQWLTWLFGGLVELSCYKSKLSDYPIDIDDTYQAIARFDSGSIGSLQVDVISPVPFVHLKLTGQETVLDWQRGEPIRLYERSKKAWRTIDLETDAIFPAIVVGEELYVYELRHFFQAMAGQVDYGYRYADYQRLVDAMQAAETPSKADGPSLSRV
jgi:predicted dehydrogenase